MIWVNRAEELLHDARMVLSGEARVADECRKNDPELARLIDERGKVTKAIVDHLEKKTEIK